MGLVMEQASGSANDQDAEGAQISLAGWNGIVLDLRHPGIGIPQQSAQLGLSQAGGDTPGAHVLGREGAGENAGMDDGVDMVAHIRFHLLIRHPLQNIHCHENTTDVK